MNKKVENMRGINTPFSKVPYMLSQFLYIAPALTLCLMV